MAAYISFQPSDHYNTVLYVGNQPADNAITGVGFSPNFVWVKNRDTTTANTLFNTVQGVGKSLYSNTDGAEVTDAQGMKSFDADGFTVGNWSQPNTNGDDYVSWNWNAATTTGLSGGTITPSSYSINATAGIGIYEYAGTGSNGTIAHGLGTGDKFLMVKNTSSGAGVNWKCIHSKLSSGDQNLYLNLTTGETTETATFNSTFPGDTVFNLGTNLGTNSSGNDYIAYLFCSKPGFSKMGSYTGNGNADGAFAFTGFRPAFVLIKRFNSSGDSWFLTDSKRDTYNVVGKPLYPDDNWAEGSGTFLDFLSNGFKLRTTSSSWNGSGNGYIYAAFAEFPLVSSNSKSGVAR
jgi:hypothetical protein